MARPRVCVQVHGDGGYRGGHTGRQGRCPRHSACVGRRRSCGGGREAPGEERQGCVAQAQDAVTSDGNFAASNAAAVNFMPLADVVEAVVGDVKPSAEQLMNAKPRASGYYRVPSMFNGAALAATVTGSADDCNVDVALESYKAHQLKYAMATKHSLKHDQERKKFESSLIESLMGPQIEKPPVI